MFRAFQALTFVAWLPLSGCATGATASLNTWDLRMCGAEDSSEWSQLHQAPAAADQFRALAVTNYYKPKSAPVEWWLARTTDELILCRSERVPQKSAGGAWWRYKRHDGEWTVVDHNAWVVVH